MEKETGEYYSPTGTYRNTNIATPHRGASAAAKRGDTGGGTPERGLFSFSKIWWFGDGV